MCRFLHVPLQEEYLGTTGRQGNMLTLSGKAFSWMKTSDRASLGPKAFTITETSLSTYHRFYYYHTVIQVG